MKYTIMIVVEDANTSTADYVEVEVDDEFPVPRTGETITFDITATGIDAVVEDVKHWMGTKDAPRSLTVRVRPSTPKDARTLQNVIERGEIDEWVAQFSTSSEAAQAEQ